MLKYTMESKKGVQSVQLKKQETPLLETFSYKGSHPEQNTSWANNATQNYLSCWNRSFRNVHEANAHLCVDLKSKTKQALPQTKTVVSLFKKQPLPLLLGWSCMAILHVKCYPCPQKGCTYWWVSALTFSSSLSNPIYTQLTTFFHFLQSSGIAAAYCTADRQFWRGKLQLRHVLVLAHLHVP